MIDLSEIAQRESERVEWKETVADVDNVIKTIVAFSNDYANVGGGYVVCGAREIQDAHGFQAVEYIGVSASKIKELEGKIIRACSSKVDPPIVPLLEEVPVPDEPDRRVLVVIAPAT